MKINAFIGIHIIYLFDEDDWWFVEKRILNLINCLTFG